MSWSAMNRREKVVEDSVLRFGYAKEGNSERRASAEDAT